MKKVLVWHQGALGDLVLSLPAVHAIRRHYERACLHVICRGEMADLIIENGLADEVTSNEKGIFGFLFGEPDCHPPDLKTFLEGFGAAFVFMRRGHEVFLQNLRRYVPQSHHISTFLPPEKKVHVSKYQLEQLAQSGIGCNGVFPILNASGRSFPSSVAPVAVHPGSGGKKKCWPLSRYLQLIEALSREERFSFSVILGPAECGGEYAILKEFISERNIRARLVRNQPVNEVAGILKKAQVFVGNDSGVTHLASALGTPVVAIFGPTDHEVWKPLGGNARIVRSGFPCSPCEEEDCRGCSGVDCLGTVGVETVLEECRRAWIAD